MSHDTQVHPDVKHRLDQSDISRLDCLTHVTVSMPVACGIGTFTHIIRTEFLEHYTGMPVSEWLSKAVLDNDLEPLAGDGRFGPAGRWHKMMPHDQVQFAISGFDRLSFSVTSHDEVVA